jgi:hypothetical protein
MPKRSFVLAVVLALSLGTTAACGSSGPHPARIELHLTPMPYWTAANHLAVGDEVWISAYAYDSTGAMVLPSDGTEVISHGTISATPAALAAIGAHCGLPTLHALASGTVTVAGVIEGVRDSLTVTIDPPGVLGTSTVLPLPACP